MASRNEKGFYKRLQSFSATDKWKALQSPVKRTPPRTDVNEVEYILGKRRRKVGQFPFMFSFTVKLNHSLFTVQLKDKRTLRIRVPYASNTRLRMLSYAYVLPLLFIAIPLLKYVALSCTTKETVLSKSDSPQAGNSHIKYENVNDDYDPTYLEPYFDKLEMT